jgi:hypothetical protein
MDQKTIAPYLHMKEMGLGDVKINLIAYRAESLSELLIHIQSF